MLVLRDAEGLSYEEIADDHRRRRSAASRAGCTAPAASSSTCSVPTPTTGSYRDERHRPILRLEPAESRAIELLRLVGSQTPAVSSRFTADLSRARARSAPSPVPLRALGGLVAAIAAALAAPSAQPVRSGARDRHRDRARRRPARRLPPADRRRPAAALVGLLAAIVLGRLTRRHCSCAPASTASPTAPGRASCWPGRPRRPRSPALVGTAVRLTIVVVAVFAALTLLGLAFLSDSLNEGILYIPRLLAALALVLIGVVLGAFMRAWIDRTLRPARLPGRDRTGRAGARHRPVRALRGRPGRRQRRAADRDRDRAPRRDRLHAGAGVRPRRAGDRALADQRRATRAPTSSAGQTIRVGECAARSCSIDGAATTLKAGDETIRIPNSMLVERIVFVEGAEPADDVTPERARAVRNGVDATTQTRRPKLFARCARREPGEPRAGGPALSARSHAASPRRYRHSGEPIEDLEQVACIGLLNAIDRFDPARGTALHELRRADDPRRAPTHFRDRTWALRVAAPAAGAERGGSSGPRRADGPRSGASRRSPSSLSAWTSGRSSSSRRSSSPLVQYTVPLDGPRPTGERTARGLARARRRWLRAAEDRALLGPLLRTLPAGTPRSSAAVPRGPHAGRDRTARRRLADAGLARAVPQPRMLRDAAA